MLRAGYLGSEQFRGRCCARRILVAARTPNWELVLLGCDISRSVNEAMTSVHAKRLARWGAAVFLLFLLAMLRLGRLAPLAVTSSPRTRIGLSISTSWIASSWPVRRHSSWPIAWKIRCTGASRRAAGPALGRAVPAGFLFLLHGLPGSGGFDQWGDLITALLDQVVIPAEQIVTEPTPRSLGRKPSIFHPPPL